MAFDLFLSNYVFWCEFHLVSINKCFLKSRILVCTCTTKVCGIACITLRKHLWQRIWYLCVLQIFQMRLCKRFDSNMIVFHSLHVCHLFTENYDWPLASLRRDARRVQPKIQQTKMLVRCQLFGDLFLFGLVWPYSSNQKNIIKVCSKSLLLTCSSNKLWANLYYIFLIRRES